MTRRPLPPTLSALAELIDYRLDPAIEAIVRRGDRVHCAGCGRDSRDGVDGWESRQTGDGSLYVFLCRDCVVRELAGGEGA